MNQAVMLSSSSNQLQEQMSLTKSNSQGSWFGIESDFRSMLSGLLFNPSVEQVMTQENGQELEELIIEFFHFIEVDLESDLVSDLVEPMLTESDSEQDQLVDYLSNLLELTDEAQEKIYTDENTMSKNYEGLYALFQQLPIVASGNEKLSHMLGTPLQEKENAAIQAVAKWNMFLQAIRQQELEGTNPALKANSMASSSSQENVPTQSASLIVSLFSKWQQDPEWLAFLKQKLHTDSATKGIVAEVIKSNPDHVPRFSLQIPMSLLLQTVNGEQAEVKSPGVSESSLLANKADTSPQLGLEQRTLPIEAKGNERVAESKPADVPVPTARFSHLMDDLKGLLRSQFQSLKQGEDSQIRIKIFPEHLGHLDIRITSIAGKISAQLMASHQMAKEALEFGLGQLRGALTQQGIQVDRIEITQHSNTQGMLQEQKSGKQFFQNKDQGSNSTSKSIDSLMEEEEFMDTQFDMDGNTVSKINYVV